MMDFPEWKAGEIVEEDVDEYLDARSARAAQRPPKIRREGRLLPKRSSKNLTSQKTLIDLAPNVECDTVDDELCDMGLFGSPLERCQDNKRSSRASLPCDTSPAPRMESLTFQRASRVAITLSTVPPSSTTLTTDAFAVDQNVATAKPSQPLSSRAASEGMQRPQDLREKRDPSRCSPSSSTWETCVRIIEAIEVPPGGSQSTNPPSTVSDRLATSPLVEGSVSHDDSETSAECDGRSIKAAPSSSSPSGIALPSLSGQTTSARCDTLRNLFCTDVRANTSACDSWWTSPIRRPRAPPSGRHVSSPSTQVEIFFSPVREFAMDTAISRSVRNAFITNACESSDLKETAASETQRCRASKSLHIKRKPSKECIASNTRGEKIISSGDDSCGDSSLLDKTNDRASGNLLRGAKVHSTAAAATSTMASPTNNAQTRGVRDSYRQGRSKVKPSLALPLIDSALESTVGELRNLGARSSVSTVSSGQQPSRMDEATSHTPQKVPNSFVSSTIATEERLPSKKTTVDKTTTPSRVAVQRAPTSFTSDRNEDFSENEETKMNSIPGCLVAETLEKLSDSHKSRPWRRRTTDFHNV